MVEEITRFVIIAVFSTLVYSYIDRVRPFSIAVSIFSDHSEVEVFVHINWHKDVRSVNLVEVVVNTITQTLGALRRGCLFLETLTIIGIINKKLAVFYVHTLSSASIKRIKVTKSDVVRVALRPFRKESDVILGLTFTREHFIEVIVVALENSLWTVS